MRLTCSLGNKVAGRRLFVMPILAVGANRVSEFERTLGGTIPKADATRPGSELKHYVKERAARRKANMAEVQRQLKIARAPFMELANKDKRFISELPALRRKLTEQFKKQRARTARRTSEATKHKIEPRIEIGSALTIKAPPYDYDQEWATGSAWSSADASVGQYSVSALDGTAWAGVGINFLAIEDNPLQRFAALIDYDYSWFDRSYPEVAHNNGSTNIWIWGFTENRWVFKNGDRLSPSWSDGTSWYEYHGSGSGDGSEQTGRESLEVYFPAFENNWYQVWVWFEGSCDSEYQSWSQQSQTMSIPLMFFGSL